jgi:hypothetical protein
MCSKFRFIISIPGKKIGVLTMARLSLRTELEFDDTPFPLLAAKRFKFPLAYHESGAEVYYAIQDWVRGLMGKQDVRSNLSQLKHHGHWEEIGRRLHRMPYAGTDGKKYQREFTTEYNLILILDHLRSRRVTPVIEEAKLLWAHYLTARLETRRKVSSSSPTTAFNGIFDEFEDEEETTTTLPIHTIDIAIQNALKSGIPVEDICDMFNCKLRIPHLLDELREHIVEPVLPKYYDIITEEIYKGLWKRSPKHLKLESGLVSIASLTYSMPYIARLFHGIVKNAALCVLSQKENLWWADIRYTVREYARFFGRMAKEMSEYLGKDLATGRPLLSS